MLSILFGTGSNLENICKKIEVKLFLMSKPKSYAVAWYVYRGAIVIEDLNASCAPCPFS